MQGCEDHHAHQMRIKQDDSLVGKRFDNEWNNRSDCFMTLPSASHYSRDQFTVSQQDFERMRRALQELQNDRDELYQSYNESISRWKAREVRMKRIIDKQRGIINRMRSCIHSGMDNNELIYLPDQSPISSGSSASLPRLDHWDRSVPVERSFVPPWDIDMDDIRRQLQDLDESICRVEQAKTGLTGKDLNKRMDRSNQIFKRGSFEAEDRRTQP